jgi:hypothetical protein
MLTYILVAIAVVVFAYVKRHGFRRAWYILRTGAEDPDWEKLGGEYFVADWEKRRRTKSDVNEETKASKVSE